MNDKLTKIVDQVAELSVMEVADLVKALEEKFGVSAAVVAAPAVAGDASSGEVKEAPTSFDVILTATGANKIGVIKALREINPNLGLKEAKDMSEKANAEVLMGAKKDAAEEAKAKLVAAGAVVELK
ncbi:50S ribosomal protein L7/L12 [Candidatus Amesbacteria bacterium]|nr:50S ribosomal protein L7/L12 [Candidatus Amesbacteria bacterium]